MEITSTGDIDTPAHQPTEPTTSPARRKPLRLWPGIAIVVLMLLARFVAPLITPQALIFGVLGGFFGSILIVLWWISLSRARWFERVGAIALMSIAMFLTYRLVDKSIANGAMGYLLFVIAPPMLTIAFVGWAFLTRRFSNTVRYISLLATILVVCGVFTLIRTGGFNGEFKQDFHWRWSKTPEQRLLAQADEPTALPLTASATSGAPSVVGDWPGFRGPQRDGLVHGTHIKTDWASSKPVELWRRPIGPGWSSFAVRGDLAYTQEQRGDDEIVACYSLATGKTVWGHTDAARFWESNAGAGPRGTPTLINGRVYSFGATGIVNALDANTGSVVWARNAATDTGKKIPGWGFSSSPLVVNDLVMIAAAGKLIAYDISNGQPRWSGPDGGVCYSSPQLATIGGVPQIVFLNGTGAIGLAPADGKVLWEHPLSSNTRIVQPAITPEGDILAHEGEANGMRRLAVAQGSSGWTVTERWTSEGLNPYFSDFVLQDGYAYGFDSNGIVCIDLKDGNRKWKGGHYGSGQLVLLPDQHVLLVLSEEGDLALVKASPDQFTELAHAPAIKGKTWNHPVLAGDVVLVRNGEEMAAFRLGVEGK